MLLSFFLKDTATTDIYTYGHTRSLHDALPISAVLLSRQARVRGAAAVREHAATNARPQTSARPCSGRSFFSSRRLPHSTLAPSNSIGLALQPDRLRG